MSQSLLTEINQAAAAVNMTINDLFAANPKPDAIYQASKHLINAGGKRLRPFLTLKTCELVGGRIEDALPIAASIELLHNFTIIHDDIMDNDKKRRGVPTVHVVWGTPLAITAGDMLFAKAYEAALSAHNVPPQRLIKAMAIITKATILICEGQTSDMLFEERRNVTEEEYLEMVYKKTAALFEAAAAAGSLIGGCTPSQQTKLSTLARSIGLAFQMVDDVLGLVGTESALGKPVGSDLREGKNTLLIIHALSQADDELRTQILDVLGNKTISEKQLKTMIRTIRSLGAVDYVVAKAKAYTEVAKAQLSIFPSSPSKNVLIDLCDYIISRSY
ncbi:MAG: polyprenyl synthetase family protein [Candidatus Bathyarchaeota archaeon]|nr:MAG: polyprenyl synthetase family protein [Candidatus Bathyarchaeota archaeon]